MLCSSQETERTFAVDKILSIRGEQELGDDGLRLRVLPYLNTQATSLVDLISWEGATEPLITYKLSKVELEKLKEEPLEVEYFPCHTQALERAVKVVYLLDISFNSLILFLLLNLFQN